MTSPVYDLGRTIQRLRSEWAEASKHPAERAAEEINATLDQIQTEYESGDRTLGGSLAAE
ncbi:hypothetical protein [Leisingera sp. ANG-M7]|uniref:hypothetical protein n=1 Tax=Leisingera sp. ANG-M7 TaxID=1577902 RepID=UPI00057D887D|nr:hypothetical protein [Leisingera sp. ANG-M7]KIC39381.1 hypothetical protein RA26_01650 [Leisingera sp. ANG-M7]